MNESKELAIPETRPLTPEARKTGNTTTGQPLEIEGETWHLKNAWKARQLDEQRDRLHNGRAFRGVVDIADIRAVAFLTLLANYDINRDEAARLVTGANEEDMARAACDAVILPIVRRNYTDWIVGGLLANGLDPETIPERDLPYVVMHLVGTKRMLPIDEFTEVDEGIKKRGALLDQGRTGR